MRMQQSFLTLLYLYPVLVAHYYSLDSGLLTVVSALISVVLWVLFGFMFLAHIQNILPRRSASLVLFSLLGIYYFAQLLSYYLQGSYFNQQYLFHMNFATLTETWEVNYALFLAFVVWIIVVCVVAWDAATTKPGLRVPIWLLPLVFVGAVFLDPGLRSSASSGVESIAVAEDESLDTIQWQTLGLNRSALPLSSTPASVPSSIPAPKPSSVPASSGKNLLLIFLEGFDRLYTDDSVFPGLTPNLLQFNKEGWQLENLTQMTGTSWTMGGLVASLCGTPLVHEHVLGGNNIMHTRFLNRANCLPDVLRKAGYQQAFMGGASLDFAGKGKFLREHSFDDTYGRELLTRKLPNPNLTGKWGLYDESLFDLAFKEFDRLSRTQKPFNLTLLTVDTHHPKGEPSPSCPKYKTIDNSILDAVHCTDFLVGRFIERVRQHPAYANTAVVMVADHLAMRNNAFSLFPEGYERRLYFNALNVEHTGPVSIPAFPTDLAPTILDFLGVKHEAGFLAGINLLQGNTRIDSFDPEDRKRTSAIEYINSNIFTPVESTERKNQILDLTEIEFTNDIEGATFAEEKLSFHTTGDDPHFLLPKIRVDSKDIVYVVLEIEVPAVTMVRVKYLDGWFQKYTRIRSRADSVRPNGIRKVIFPMPVEANFSKLRVDLGKAEGQYTLHSITVQQ